MADGTFPVMRHRDRVNAYDYQIWQTEDGTYHELGINLGEQAFRYFTGPALDVSDGAMLVDPVESEGSLADVPGWLRRAARAWLMEMAL